MPGNINAWPELLAQVNPETQQCTFPYSPAFVADPTQTDTAHNTVTHLNPEDWATAGCTNYICSVLGGIPTEVAPSWSPQIGPPYRYDQPHYWITLTNGEVIDPADLVKEFIHSGNLAVLKQSIPQFLGITQ